MTKRKTALGVSILAILALVAGCDNGTKPIVYTAPDMGKVEDIPRLEGATSPTDAAEAKTLFIDAMQAFHDDMETENPPPSTPSVCGSRKTETFSQNISWKEAYGSGNIDITGVVTSSNTYPDDGDPPPAPGQTSFPGYTKVMANGDISGTISNVKFVKGADEYTVNGKIKELVSINISMDLYLKVVGENVVPERAVLNMGFGFSGGYSLAIKNNAGKGARYLVSFGTEKGFSNIEFDMNTPNAGKAKIEEAMATMKATIKAYDNDNKELSSQEIMIAELPGFSFSF